MSTIGSVNYGPPQQDLLLVVVVCTVSNCFTNFVLPSHTSTVCSSFCNVTFIMIHLLALVSRCESARIASILPTCVLYTLSHYFCDVFIPRAAFRDLYAKVRILAYDWKFIFSPLTSVRNLPGSPYLRYVQLLRTYFLTFAVATHSLVYYIFSCHPTMCSIIFYIDHS